MSACTGSRSSSSWTGPASPATTGPSHHGVLDMVLRLSVPGMTVFAPSSAEEVGVMLTEALKADGPSTIRSPRRRRPMPRPTRSATA